MRFDSHCCCPIGFGQMQNASRCCKISFPRKGSQGKYSSKFKCKNGIYRLLLPKVVSKLLLVVGLQPSLATQCREHANSVSMKSSRTFIPMPWVKKAHTKTKLSSIWLPLLLPSSSLILLFAQWRLSRLVFLYFCETIKDLV